MNAEQIDDIKQQKGEFWSRLGAADVYERGVSNESGFIQIKNQVERTLVLKNVKGVILDADGSVIYDLYDEFGISPATVSFDLGNANTNVKTKCAEVLRHLEDNLKGEFMTGIHVLCSPEFFDALTGHAKVEKA